MRRCKLVCTSVTDQRYPNGKKYSESIHLAALNGIAPENEWLSKDSSTVSLLATIKVPENFGTFKINRKYFIDITEAEA